MEDGIEIPIRYHLQNRVMEMPPQSSTSSRKKNSWARGLLALATFLLIFLLRQAHTFPKTSNPSITTKQAEQPLHSGETKCSPIGIHIAQSGDVMDGLVGMTVSFLIRRECNMTVHKPIVSYKSEDGDAVLTALPNDSKSGSYRSNPISYEFTNARKEYSYSSDWIYHIELPNLVAASTYLYQITTTQEASKAEQDIADLPKIPKQGKGQRSDRHPARSLRKQTTWCAMV